GDFGFNTAACASTGNLANAVAAHAAHAGMSAYIFIPADLEQGKVVATAVYGPQLIAVQGTYDDVNRLCSEIAGQYEWAFVNVNIRPYYAEGSKSLAFEIAEQLGWRPPDHVIVPIASGSLLTKIRRGLDELVKVGLLDGHQARISGAQAEGCSPVATAFKAGEDHVRPVKPNTIAKSLAIGNPADGYYAIKPTRESGGAMESVTDEEIIVGIPASSTASARNPARSVASSTYSSATKTSASCKASIRRSHPARRCRSSLPSRAAVDRDRRSGYHFPR